VIDTAKILPSAAQKEHLWNMKYCELFSP